MRTVICLSHILSQNTPSYGNRDKFLIRNNSAISSGESANSSTWIFTNNHIGTHIDAPRHFSNSGLKTFEIPLADYYFDKVALVDIPCEDGILISINDIIAFEKKIPFDVELLLIRTGYENFRSTEKYWCDSPGLASELADYFREKYSKLRCVGFDFISLTSWNFRLEGKKSHLAFLVPGNNKRSILIIEDMKLNHIKEEIKKLIVAPLLVEDGNGGAVTIFGEI